MLHMVERRLRRSPSQGAHTVKVPNRVLNIVVRMAETPHPDITPPTPEERAVVLKWATEGLTKRAAMAAQPRTEV